MFACDKVALSGNGPQKLQHLFARETASTGEAVYRPPTHQSSVPEENPRGEEVAHGPLQLSWPPIPSLRFLSLELKSPDLPGRAGLGGAPVG